MRLHEVIEQAAAALFIFRDVLLQCRYRHGADVAYCEDRGELDAQGEAFDVAVEFAREHERGLQCRVHEIMRLDRNENGLETHGDLLVVRTPPAVGGGGRGFKTSRRFAHAPPGERSAPRSLSSIMPTARQARSRAA